VGTGVNSRVVQDPRESQNHVVLRTPVLVYGRDLDDSAFLDEAPVISLNANGGVLALAANVRRGQIILLVNDGLQQDRELRILYVGASYAGRRKIAFEFVRR
jgi:hypothetical protein